MAREPRIQISSVSICVLSKSLISVLDETQGVLYLSRLYSDTLRSSFLIWRFTRIQIFTGFTYKILFFAHQRIQSNETGYFHCATAMRFAQTDFYMPPCHHQKAQRHFIKMREPGTLIFWPLRTQNQKFPLSPFQPP